MSSPTESLRSGWPGDLFAGALIGAWLLFWRAAFEVPWGIAPAADASGLVNLGIVYNPGDTWSYLSWVQQYYRGENLAGLLYTTEPHDALLWLFPLWLVGRVAELTALPPLGVFNVAGWLAAMLLVVAFRRTARALGLSNSAQNWATVALVLGTGGSWIAHLAKRIGIGEGAAAPELFFLDLFPSTTVLVYAYHALGLALLAIAWWLAIATENRIARGERAKPVGTALVLAALLLSFSRPYEPFAFAGAWAVKSLWHAVRRRRESDAWKAALRVGLLLAMALAPGMAWTAWVSTRPVWSTFAGESLQLGRNFGLAHWTLALGGWLALCGIGAVLAWRSDRRRAVLPIATSVLAFAILLIFGSGKAKLASGLLLGPAILAGWALAWLTSVAATRLRFVGAVAAAALAFVLLGLPSYAMALLAIRLSPDASLSTEFLTLAREIPVDADAPPVVLADTATAEALPGLIGARVWAGHFSLTHRYWKKRARLVAAGLDPTDQPHDPASAEAALSALLRETRFDYALLDARCAHAVRQLAAAGWSVVRAKPDFVLLRAPLPRVSGLAARAGWPI